MAVWWPWMLSDDPGELEIASLPRRSLPRRLTVLAREADQGDPVHLQRYALALALGGRVEDAARLWAHLTRAQPSSLPNWLNLATALLHDNRPDAAADALRRARETLAHDPALVADVDARIGELQQVREQTDTALRLAELQVVAIRERLAHGAGQTGDRLRLAQLLCQLMFGSGRSVTLDEALSAVRSARDEDPADPAALELLVAVLTQAGLTDEREDVLRKLEAVAPHSKVLETVRQVSRPDPALEAEVGAHQRRTRDLVGRAVEGDPEAEAEIRDRLRRHPNDPSYRIGLIMALFGRGERSQAVRLAAELAADHDGNHYVHFHLTQVYWYAGDRAEARRHGLRALETAANRQDRQEVHEIMRGIGAESLLASSGDG